MPAPDLLQRKIFEIVSLQHLPIALGETCKSRVKPLAILLSDKSVNRQFFLAGRLMGEGLERKQIRSRNAGNERADAGEGGAAAAMPDT